MNFISLSVPKKELLEEFKAVLPLLEKCLVNQLYILKKSNQRNGGRLNGKNRRNCKRP